MEVISFFQNSLSSALQTVYSSTIGCVVEIKTTPSNPGIYRDRLFTLKRQWRWWIGWVNSCLLRAWTIGITCQFIKWKTRKFFNQLTGTSLKNIYPNYAWMTWKSRHFSSLGEKKESFKLFFELLSTTLQMIHLQKCYGKCYPQHQWDSSKQFGNLLVSLPLNLWGHCVHSQICTRPKGDNLGIAAIWVRRMIF